MQNNYDRLFDELTQLLCQKEVLEGLDENLKPRIERLMSEKGRMHLNEKINELSKNDNEQLFGAPIATDMSNKFQRIVLKDNSNSLNKKSALNTSTSKTGKSYPARMSGVKNEEKNHQSSSKRLLTSKSRQKSSKAMITYNTQLINRSKSRQRSNSKYGISQNSAKHKNITPFVQQKNTKKLSMFQRRQKQNINICPPKFSKNQPSFPKTDSQSKISNIIQTKSNLKNTNFNQSRQVLKKLAVIQTQPSRLSLNSSKFYRQSIKEKSLQKQVDLFEALGNKQDQINYEKRSLQEAVRQMREKIEKEKIQLQTVKKNISTVQKVICKKQTVKNECCFEVKLSRKKSQNFFSEAKQMEQKIIQTNKTNDFLLGNITEEKYLIDMYETVIQQMKNQLKIEQHEKLQLKKRLNLLKNCQKMISEKHEIKKGLSNQIFESMRESIKKL